MSIINIKIGYNDGDQVENKYLIRTLYQLPYQLTAYATKCFQTHT